MRITDLTSLKQLLEERVKIPVFGVCVYAFDRLALEDLLPNYRILALRYSLDTELIGNDLAVFSLEKGMGTEHIREPRNSTTVLKYPRAKEYLSRFKNPALVVYKTSSRMEKICEENGWLLVGAPVKFGKELLEDKVKFRKILEELSVPSPPGEIAAVTNLLSGKLSFKNFVEKYGLPLVLQHPRRGGGKGTFFIHSEEEWQNALEKLRVHEKEGREVREDIERLEVIIAKYVHGPSPSITGCVTTHGILSTSLQYQLIDIPQLYNPQKGSGLFCGHDWTSSRFPEDIEKQAYKIVKKLGTYFRGLGYKGIFGIDFVLNEKERRLYITECNPRLLGSFPMISMAQLYNNEPPILAFHLLEYLNVDYDIDLNQINALMRQPKVGAQMFLHNLTQSWVKNHNEVRAGVYKLKFDKLEFIRPGYALKHLKSADEFLLTDGVLQKKSHYSPNRRLCRIITLNSVLAKNKKGPASLSELCGASLTPWASQVAESVHAAFNLKKVRFPKLIKFFKRDYLAKG